MSTAILLSLVWVAGQPPVTGGEDRAQAVRDHSIVQTLLRLPNIDVNARPKLRAAVLRHLSSKRGTTEYLQLVERLKLRGVEDELLRMALEDPEGNLGVRAATLLLRRERGDLISKVISADDDVAAVKAAKVLGLVGSETANQLLRPIVTDADRTRTVRVAAAAGLGRTLSGQRFLIGLARDQKLADDLKFTVANALYSSPDPSIRADVAQHLKLPAGADTKPIPPVSVLAKRRGDADRGARLFRTTATCAKCHKVRGDGKEVGPDLSEIGSKLSRAALYLSILDPSAGVSHNYETYVAVLDTGNVVSGVLVTRDDDQVTLRTAEAIDKTMTTSAIDELVKSQVSLMPADLQKTMTVQQLVDVVEYMTTLRKSE